MIQQHQKPEQGWTKHLTGSNDWPRVKRNAYRTMIVSFAILVVSFYTVPTIGVIAYAVQNFAWGFLFGYEYRTQEGVE